MITIRSDHSLSHDIKLPTGRDNSTGKFTWGPQFFKFPTPVPDVINAQLYDISLFDPVIGSLMGSWDWPLFCLGRYPFWPHGGFLKGVGSLWWILWWIACELHLIIIFYLTSVYLSISYYFLSILLEFIFQSI